MCAIAPNGSSGSATAPTKATAARKLQLDELVALYRRIVRDRRGRTRLDRGRHRARHCGPCARHSTRPSMTVFAEATLTRPGARLHAERRPRRAPFRASRLHPRRIAVPAASLSGSEMVSAPRPHCLGPAMPRTMLSACARGGGRRGRSGNSRALDRRSRRAARRAHGRRRRRSRYHADLFRLSGHEPDRAQCGDGADRRRFRACRGSRPCCRRPGPPTG